MEAKEARMSQNATLPPQKQDRQPGIEAEMTPRPRAEDASYRGSGKLTGKAAVITGGDSGIGRAVAVAFAKEGADVAIVYLDEEVDARETQRLVEEHGRRCVRIAGDVGNESFCRTTIERIAQELGHLDILVNNAAVQFPKDDIEAISEEQLERTFRTNVFSCFFMTKAALPHLKERKGCIINTTS